tara:strand:+ start:1111 stop:1629 length:519 start_codon:yes stop_codon:yes gene_type:complete
MSYIQVESVEETVAKAKELNGVIELVDLDNPIGSVALIRDTSGAGFTVYEGNMLDSRTKSEINTLIYNELHVSDAQKAITFYEQLFNWRCHWINEYSLDVYCTLSENKLSTIHQIDNSIKGKYEYWTCVFGVANLQESIDKIINLNGIVIDKEKKRALCSDGSEAFFYIQEV